MYARINTSMLLHSACSSSIPKQTFCFPFRNNHSVCSISISFPLFNFNVSCPCHRLQLRMASGLMSQTLKFMMHRCTNTSQQILINGGHCGGRKQWAQKNEVEANNEVEFNLKIDVDVDVAS